MAELERKRRVVRPKTVRITTIIVVLVAAFLYWLLARAVQGVDFRLSPSPRIDQLLDRLPLLEPLLIFFELFSPYVLRHFIPIAFGVACGWIIAVHLVQKLYELPTYSDASRMLNRLATGTGGTVQIDRRIFAEQVVEEELLRTGGPGYVVLSESDVAVTEINGRFERVIGRGRQRLRRFERIVAVLDLREQERARNDVTLMTKEGLELKTSLHINFQLRRQPDPSQPNSDYSYDDDSVRKAAYNVTVAPNGMLRWDDQPMRVVVAQLRRIVASKRLDELIDPKYVFEGSPHPDIQIAVEQDSRDILRGMGIHLVSARTTTLEMSEAMHETLIGYWKAFGEQAKALEERPQDPDYDSADIARRRAREKMIGSLTTGLETIRENRNVTARRIYASPEPAGPDLNQILTLQLIQLLKNAATAQQLPPEKRSADEQAMIESGGKDFNAEIAGLLSRILPPTE